MARLSRLISTSVNVLYILAVLGSWGLAIWAYLDFIHFPGRENLSFGLGEQGTIEMLHPEWLVLALVIPGLWLWRTWTLSDLPWLQQVLSVVLRSLLVLGLVLAVTRVVVTRFESKVAVVVLVDVSESVPDELLAGARDVIQELYDRRGSQDVRVITFAREAHEMRIPPGTGQIPEIARHPGQGAGLASNLPAAIQLAYGAFPRDSIKRCLIISDGHLNRGDVLSAAYNAVRHGIRISSREIDFQPLDEVLIRAVDFPEGIVANEPFHITVDVFSTYSGQILLDLTQNDFRDIRGRSFEVSAGQTTQLDLVAEVYEPGVRNFEIAIRAERDHFEDNNRITHTVEVSGRPQVLYIEGESRRSTYLARALDDERNSRVDFDLDARSPSGLPQEPADLERFDLIILSDVEASQVPRQTMSNLGAYVRDYGGGFLMIGGENSLGPGGYRGTIIEDILPVTLEPRRSMNMPSAALMLVIDRSGSMEGLKLEMAKDAARASVQMLGPQDRVGVIAFDSAPQQVVRLQSASNRLRIENDIARISPGGGTDIYPALEEAYLQLVATRASTRHIILLSDGESPRQGISDLVDQIRSDRISISTVGVGAEADRDLLEMIADLSGGRFYYTASAQAIPQIFVSETSRVTRTNIVEEPFRPVVGNRSAATSGIDFSTAPYLLGYVSTQARSRATVELSTDQGEPLYAYWRYGRGRSAVFTSDCKNRWMVEWLTEPLYPRFWAQVAGHLMRQRERTERELGLDAWVEQGRGHIRVDAVAQDDSFLNDLQSNVALDGPDSADFEISLRQTAAGRYEADFDLPRYGSYRIEAQHRLGDEIIATSLGSLTNPYPDEYLVVGADHTLTRQIVALGSGYINPGPATLFNPEGERSKVEQDIWPYFLFAALGLLVLDILSRRIRLYGRTALSWAMVKRK